MPLFTHQAHGKKFIIEYQLDRCEVWVSGHLVRKIAPVPVDLTGAESPQARLDAVRNWVVAQIDSDSGFETAGSSPD